MSGPTADVSIRKVLETGSHIFRFFRKIAKKETNISFVTSVPLSGCLALSDCRSVFSSVRPSIRVEKLGSHCKNFFQKSDENYGTLHAD